MGKLRQPGSRRWQALLAACATLILGIGGAITGASTAAAVSAQDFDPGNIISDEYFYDGFALSAAQTQEFLDARMPRCTIGDPGRGAGTPHGSTVIAKQCLNDFKMRTQTRAANPYCAAYLGGYEESAAQIIAKVGAACNISPKVLLVMLEKEQSLVTDTWPTQRQFDIAMGYACPDSGPNNSANCDPSQTGFFQQVYRAAWQLQVYRAFPDSYRYKPFQVNQIQWHPNQACGTSPVHIQNWATAALYIYTPYRPNQAALNAGWGTGDTCSSYGNRNFFLLYTSWFGNSTLQQGTPVGEVRELWTESNAILMWGWALDLDDRAAALQIHVKFGDSWAATTAGAPNSTAEALYPGSGPNHGFGLRITAPPGPQRVCVYAKNVGAGLDRLLTCRDVVVPSGNPVGEVKEIWATPGNIKMWGWALDPDTLDPIDLHVSINGRWAVVKANAQNSSTLASYPAHGINHGFGASIPADPGNNRVCVYGINQGAGANTTLLCKNVMVQSGNPVGEVKEIWATPGNIKMWGWALDPDTLDPIDLHVSINGRWAVVKANAQNSSTLASYPAHGINHGFGASIPADPGNNRVCVYAINQGPGANSTLRCQDVFVASGNPKGEVKEMWGVTGQIKMWGWAADPDTSDSIELHVRVNQTQWFVIHADSPYPSMSSLLPGVGINHGFGGSIPISPGNHEVCVFAVNIGPGTSQTLRCAYVSTT
ncbi:hypothetical protein [Leucobacter sp. W1478]|uniref:hypothetical protein n=1 Tax=Leucobacter sp. W1478 TaxID=3439065 RepID=UPI003F3FEB8A